MDLRALFDQYRVGDSNAYAIEPKAAAALLAQGLLVRIPRPVCAEHMLYCPATGGVAYVRPASAEPPGRWVPAGDNPSSGDELVRAG